MQRTNHGFSLVELSIVLVILGLLVGGVLAGKSLIRAAEMRSVTADFQRYRTATYAFRDKYFALPGDMGNATTFWGIRTGSSSTTGSDTACVSVLNASGGTCNGIADGVFNSYAGTWPSYGISERYLFWQHMALAGLIEGKYSGSYYAAGTAESPAGAALPNAPAGRLPESYWTASLLLYNNASYFTDFAYNGNALYARSYTNGYALMLPEEAWNIDTKLDDGSPGSGAVFSYKNTAANMPNCTTTDLAATALYSLSTTTKICSLLMKL